MVSSVRKTFRIFFSAYHKKYQDRQRVCIQAGNACKGEKFTGSIIQSNPFKERNMVTAQRIEGNWNELKGKLQKKWGRLTDDVLSHFHGGMNELSSFIERETGESRKEVEKYLDELSSQGQSMYESAASSARDYSQQAAKTISETSRQAMDQLKSGYSHTEDLVHNRPMESVAITFGAGLAIGVLVGLLLRSK
jgi:ElaB/YqjD/DUF883 family membrane-anchored ribosome-binding protein